MQVAITCSSTKKAPYWQQINDIQRGDEIIGEAVYTIDARGLALQVSALKQAPAGAIQLHIQLHIQLYMYGKLADKCGWVGQQPADRSRNVALSWLPKSILLQKKLYYASISALLITNICYLQ